MKIERKISGEFYFQCGCFKYIIKFYIDQKAPYYEEKSEKIMGQSGICNATIKGD